MIAHYWTLIKQGDWINDLFIFVDGLDPDTKASIVVIMVAVIGYIVATFGMDVKKKV